MASIQSTSRSGISWSLAGQMTKRGLYVAFAVWLAHLLEPESFGLMAMATAVIGFASVFSDMGLSLALIYDRESGDRQYQSVFIIHLIMGILLTTATAALSPAVAAFYGDPRLLPLSQWLSLGFVLSVPHFIPMALLRKELAFKKIALTEIAVTALSGGAAIAFAYAGAGVYAIVIQTLFYKVLLSLVLWWVSPWRIHLRFRRGRLRGILTFSAYSLATEIVDYTARNIDNILIGKYMGSASLGFYDFAYKVMLSPNIFISSAISNVLFPVFSKIQQDTKTIKSMFLKAQRVLVLIVAPAMLGLVATADVFILTILGPNWSGMTRVLQIMAFVGAQKAVGALLTNLYLSQGRVDLSFRYAAFSRVLLIGSIIAGLPWGIEGVAFCYAVARTIVSVPNTVAACRLVEIGRGEIFRNTAGIFLLAGGMAGVVYGIKSVWLSDESAWLQLLLCTTTGILLYIFLLYFFRVKAWKELRTVSRDLFLQGKTGGKTETPSPYDPK